MDVKGGRKVLMEPVGPGSISPWLLCKRAGFYQLRVISQQYAIYYVLQLVTHISFQPIKFFFKAPTMGKTLHHGEPGGLSRLDIRLLLQS